jgi:hypothetical protein
MPPAPLQGFDFSLLDDPNFREDSVREEIVVPLLGALGYSASPPHRILRSLRLAHPFVYIGSARKDITIIPDYLLQRDGRNSWILDAKAPGEAIDRGKNVEQAYSYAIHPDVRVEAYALCNGRHLTVFHISELAPMLDVQLGELPNVWPQVLALLGTSAAWPDGARPGFLPDLGLALRKAGLDRDESGQKYWQVFMSVPLEYISRLEDDLYSTSSAYSQEYLPGHHQSSMLTFEFGDKAYRTLLEALPEAIRGQVEQGLRRQPYQLIFTGEPVLLTVHAEPGDAVQKNNNESFCPFIAEEFIPEPAWPDEPERPD